MKMNPTSPQSTHDEPNAPCTVASPSRRRFIRDTSAVLLSRAAAPGMSYAGAASAASTSVVDGGEAHEASLLEAAHAINAKRLTSERYTELLLERTHKLASLNSFITVDEDKALAAARAADKARLSGETKALPGLPIGVKDSYLTKDLPTSFGTAVARGFTPAADAKIVTSVKDAGCIVLGKNNLVEMSYGLTGLNGHYGQAKNPYNVLHITGGSSCGGAASVAARLVPAALGGDTVGSIRVPAALCGVVGFKPTPGRWSGSGVAPISNALDTTGPIARRVSDCELLDSIATGGAPSAQRLPKGLKGTRLAVARQYYLDGADPEVEKIFNETIYRLKDAGASVVEVDLGTDFGPMVEEANWALFFHDTQPDVTAFLRDQNVPITFEEIYEGLEPHIKARWQRFVLATGAGYTGEVAYRDALARRRPEVRRRFDTEVFSRADAIVFPTTLCAAPTIAEQWEYTVAGRTVNDVFLSRNTYPASFAGLPGISIPMGLTRSGLPIGLELDASSGSDRALLTLARRVEQIIGFVRPPSLSA